MLIEFNVEPARNDGAVKVNDGNGVVPGWANGDADSINNQWQNLSYGSPLGLSSFPTTSWPLNNPAPVDGDIYDVANETFIENTIPGQTNLWRIQCEFNKVGQGGGRIQIEMRNTLSTFVIGDYVSIPGALDEGEFSITFLTIADGASLPPPLGTGQGYEIRFMADNNNFQEDPGNFLRINSITRVSLHYANRS